MHSANRIVIAFLIVSFFYFFPKQALADWIDDLIPPVITISTDCPDSGCTNQANVSITCYDPGPVNTGCILIEYKINGESGTTKGLPYSKTLTTTTNNITATGTDKAGNKQTSSYSFNIIPIPTLNVSCSVSPNPTQPNYVVTWTANASGGTGSYSYNWSITDGWGGYGQQIYTQHSFYGQKTVTVTVRSGDQTKTATCSVVVNPPPKNPPTPFKISSSSPSCEGGKPVIEINWTKSNNANYYLVYRQRWDNPNLRWVVEYAGNSYTLNYKDFGIVESTPYYYYVYALGNDNPPAWSGWSNITYTQNCNLPPSDFSINPNPPKDYCTGAYNTYPAAIAVNWERPANTTAVSYYVYRYTVNTGQYEGPLTQISDPQNSFWDFSVTNGYQYKYAIVAVNPKSFPVYTLAGNSYQTATNPVLECNRLISGHVYLKDTTTPYTGTFTLNSADKISLTYSYQNGYYFMTVPPKPGGGRDYYDFYMYAPSGYRITSATNLTGQTCGPGSLPCNGILYGGLPFTWLQSNPNLNVNFDIEPIPPPPSISGTYYLNNTQTPYTGSFTVNSPDLLGSVTYSGSGKFNIPLTQTPGGGRSYYAFYLYPPSGYNIINAPFAVACGNSSNAFPCSSIIYSNIESYRFSPAGPNLDVILSPIPPTITLPPPPPTPTPPTTVPYIKTSGGDVHSNTEIKGTQ